MPVLRAAIAASAALIVTVAVSARDASAQPKAKAKSACGIKLMPLTVGNKWTFIPATPPAEPPADQVRYIPLQPKQVVIEVKDIVADGGKSVVKLEEDIDGRKIETTITCGGGVFEVSPESFFFAGEPGGDYGVELTGETRTLKDTDAGPSKPWGNVWREDLIAKWKRTPEEGMQIDLGDGTLEVERVFRLGKPEKVSPVYKKDLVAQRLTIEVSGRVSITGVKGTDAAADKKFEMPAGLVNTIWFSPDLGPVQASNSYYHAYQLSDVVIVK
jgi:hypothetical protein